MMNRSAKGSNTKRRIRRSLSALGIGLLLCFPGCRLPKLQNAEAGAPLPNDFNGAVTAESSAQIGWREFFDDPTLVVLVDQAFAGNQELKILGQRVRRANYEIMARRGAYLPFLGMRTGASLEKPSLFTPLGAVEDQLQPVPGVGFPDPLPNFLVAADISWEIDIWRKLRNARDAASLRYFATREGQNYVVTRLVAEVAGNYYELMALDNRMEALNRTIEIQQQSLDASVRLKQAGRETELAVQRFQAEVRKNESQRLIIQQQIVEVENRINFNLGRFPQRVARESSKFLELNLPLLHVGVPSQLLRNRADIRQAERELAAAGLDVRVARARFYPSLNLTATVGTEAFSTKYLFRSPESLVYGVAGELAAPLINRAAIKADYLSANAMQLEKVYEYQRVVLRAFTEVINRLAKVANYGTSIEGKRQQLQSLEASVDSATKLFQAAHPGIEYMDILLAQRDLMEAKMGLIETKLEQVDAIIDAYQALGGGANQVPQGFFGIDDDDRPPEEVNPPAGVGNPPPPFEIVPTYQPVRVPVEVETLPPAAEPQREALPPAGNANAAPQSLDANGAKATTPVPPPASAGGVM